MPNGAFISGIPNDPGGTSNIDGLSITNNILKGTGSGIAVQSFDASNFTDNSLIGSNKTNVTITGNQLSSLWTGSSIDIRGGAGSVDKVLVQSNTLQNSAGMQNVITQDGHTTNATINQGANDGAGADVLIGGADNDAFFVDNAGDLVVEKAGEGSSDTVYSTVHYRLPDNVENLVLQGSADLQGYGNALANSIVGNSGSNILNGGAGADFLMGGAGNDAYFVDNAGDLVVENASEGSSDTVYSTVHYRLPDNVENLLLLGNADLQGYGNALANTIVGNSGSNILNGGAAADVLMGGAGNDAYFVDNAGDLVVENAGEGTDTVYSTVHYRLPANVENLLLQGNADLQGYGNALANTIVGNSGTNILDGGAGADVLMGGTGNDAYFVDNAGDLVFENAGEGNDTVFASINYTLTANVENLILQGSDNLVGSGNNLTNAIFGNSGNNVLDGRAGADVLQGNAGNDTFVFRAGEADGDAAVDFTGNGASAGDLLTFVGFGTVAQGAMFTQIGTTNQWQIHSGLDGHNEVVKLMNGAAVHPTDVLFS